MRATPSKIGQQLSLPQTHSTPTAKNRQANQKRQLIRQNPPRFAERAYTASNNYPTPDPTASIDIAEVTLPTTVSHGSTPKPPISPMTILPSIPNKTPPSPQPPHRTTTQPSTPKPTTNYISSPTSSKKSYSNMPATAASAPPSPSTKQPS